MSRRDAVLSSYRTLLRATKITFDTDVRLLTASRNQIRNQYEHDRTLLSNTVEQLEIIDEKINHAIGVGLVLRSNVVQGVSEPSPAITSSQSPPSSQSLTTDKNDEKPVYKLRIHEQTELGDNETIKGAKSNLAGTSKKFQKPTVA
ncbi:hypothetical protein V1514DRAFT_323221 [Lipomyces japonicus]|uniref:uncharacterized protein n=1 Tax=Lipomyces japonicus TaxID=56871 RepID=UPI0034CDED5A